MPKSRQKAVAVVSVDRASRSGEGWYVAGELDGGTPYTCWIDGNGRVTGIEAGDYGASYDAPVDDGEGGDGGYATLQKQPVERRRPRQRLGMRWPQASAKLEN